MAFKPITANTPAEEPAHILSEDDAAIYAGVIGGDCVLDIGNKLNATVITNNSVRISDGVVFVGGHAGRIIKGDYEDMVITNGVSGQKRYDIIAARFMTTGPGGTDTFKLVVIKGASGATPTDPAIVKGDLYAGDKQRDYPLWRVCLDGLSIIKMEQMHEVIPNIVQLSADLKYDIGATEVKTGRTFRGKPIYCRLVEIGSMPKATTKSVPINLAGASNYWLANGFMISSDAAASYSLPHTDPSNWGNSVYIKISKSEVYVYTTSNWSNYCGYAVVEYTKV